MSHTSLIINILITLIISVHIHFSHQFHSYEPGQRQLVNRIRIFWTRNTRDRKWKRRITVEQDETKDEFLFRTSFLLRTSSYHSNKMNEDRIVNVSIISLILKNFHTWVKKIKIIAKNAEIWKFVDSEDTAEVSEKDASLNVSDYQITVSAISTSPDTTRSVTALRELN
jgi:hypothetical protein